MLFSRWMRGVNQTWGLAPGFLLIFKMRWFNEYNYERLPSNQSYRVPRYNKVRLKHPTELNPDQKHAEGLRAGLHVCWLLFISYRIVILYGCVSSPDAGLSVSSGCHGNNRPNSGRVKLGGTDF